jgi:hypothetical protein
MLLYGDGGAACSVSNGCFHENDTYNSSQLTHYELICTTDTAQSAG